MPGNGESGERAPSPIQRFAVRVGSDPTPERTLALASWGERERLTLFDIRYEMISDFVFLLFFLFSNVFIMCIFT